MESYTSMLLSLLYLYIYLSIIYISICIFGVLAVIYSILFVHLLTFYLWLQSNQAQDEIKKLATQYGKLLGHQNQKQKIQVFTRETQQHKQTDRIRDNLGQTDSCIINR